MIEESFLLEIAQTYGTPIYVIDETEIERATREISSSFSVMPNRVLIAYPYKANSLRKICEYMHELGWWAEAASILEIEMALRVGIAPSNIIYNAPYKADADLIYAIKANCRIHLDNFEEIEQIQRLVASLSDLRAHVGIRLSSSSNTGWDRFGFQIGDEAYRGIERIRDEPQLELVALHGHRSNVANLAEYRDFVSRIFDFARKVRDQYKVELKYIDIGSGFAVYEPRPSHVTEWSVPSMSEYANTVLACLEHAHIAQNIDLIIEPGRRSVASCATLITKVTNIKSRNDKMIVTVDSALNFIPGAEIYRYTISKLHSVENIYEEVREYTICGCLCDSLDIISPSTQLPALAPNDFISIANVGGYDIARSFTWQLPLPPILWIDKNRTLKIVREKGKLPEIW